MRLLIVTPWYPDSYTDQHGNFILDSVEALSSLGHQVTVLVTRPWIPFRTKRAGCRMMSTAMHARGYPIACIEYLSIPRNYLRWISDWFYVHSCGSRLRELIRTGSFDAVHAHTELSGYMAALVARPMGIPVVTTVHGVNRAWRYQHGWGRRRFFKTAFAGADRLVLVGASLRAFVGCYVDRLDHVRLVANGFRQQSEGQLRNRSALTGSDRLELISVSNLVDGKGVDVNLAALTKLDLAGRRDWCYTIVGDGPGRAALEADATKRGLSDRVSFAGRCSTEEVFRRLNTGDVFCLPSSPEAFGVAYLEAMSCGLLAIGVAGQGPSTFITDGVDGLLLSKPNANELADRLLEIFDNRESFRRMAVRGKEKVNEGYTWQHHASVLSQVITEAVSEALRLPVPSDE